MDTVKAFLEYRHPVDGVMSLSVVGDLVCFFCEWPFDLDTDEWIYITNDFDADAYTNEVSLLPEKGTVRIPGKQSGYMEFTVLTQEKLRLDVEDSSRDRPPRFVYTLDLHPSDLLPDLGDASSPRCRGPRLDSDRVSRKETRS